MRRGSSRRSSWTDAVDSRTEDNLHLPRPSSRFGKLAKDTASAGESPPFKLGLPRADPNDSTVRHMESGKSCFLAELGDLFQD